MTGARNPVSGTPQPGGGLTWAKGRYESIRGPIASEWRIENQRFRLRVTIPANTTATVVVPTAKPELPLAVDAAPGVAFERTTDGARIYRVESGRYAFDAPWQ